jgi:hypothetical protein
MLSGLRLLTSAALVMVCQQGLAQTNAPRKMGTPDLRVVSVASHP